MSDLNDRNIKPDPSDSASFMAGEVPDSTGAALGMPEQHVSLSSTGPWRLALRYLLHNPIALACIIVMALYFLIAVATYLRIPDSPPTYSTVSGQSEPRLVSSGVHDFIGEWFENLASRQLVDPTAEPLTYLPPYWGTGYHNESKTSTPTASSDWHEPSRLDLLLGTDIQGRSVFWQALYGARFSLTIALFATLIAISIGTVLGALAGYLGGYVDVIVTWLFTTVASIPQILLILALAYALKNRTMTVLGHTISLTGMTTLILAMGLTTWDGICRTMRGEILKQKSMDYESAARALGFSRSRILFRHLLPNATYLIIIQASLIFPLFIQLEVILSYLGLGVQGAVSWGQMISESLQEMMRQPPVWWKLAAATAMVFGICLALNIVGDALRDALDPKVQSSGK